MDLSHTFTPCNNDIFQSVAGATYVLISWFNVKSTAPIVYQSAQDVSRTRTHKMISASDVLKAIELIEMPDMVPILQRELESELHILRFLGFKPFGA